MAESTLVKKLGIKPNFKLLILNAPQGYEQLLGTLPESATLKFSADGDKFDHVQLFVKSKADLEQHAQTALQAVKPGGMLWMAYPKKSSKIKTDITRDIGWDVIRNAGWEGVSLISIDDTWSSMRYRPQHEIKPK